MRCAEFDDRLQALLDERIRPEADPALCAHAQTCPPCGELLDAQELLFEGLSALPRPEPHADLAARILRDLQVATTATPRWNTARTWFPWVAAAAILIASAVLLNRSESGKNPPVAAPLKGGVVVPAVAHAGTFRQEYVAFARDTGETVALALRWPGVGLDGAPPPPMPESDVANTPEWVEDVTNGIRPLTKSMGAAIDALRTIPGALAKSG